MSLPSPPQQPTIFPRSRASSRGSGISSCSRATVVEGFINGLHRHHIWGRRRTSPSIARTCRATTSGASIGGCARAAIGYYVKEYEADTNTNFLVVLDVSPSMRYGGDPRGRAGVSKLTYGCYLAALSHVLLEPAARPRRHRDVRPRHRGLRAAVGQASAARAARARPDRARRARREGGARPVAAPARRCKSCRSRCAGGVSSC